MTDYVVLAHHYDKDQGIYRLIIATPVTGEVPMTDSEGKTLLDNDDNPLTELKVIDHVGVEDFVFAADDERWQGLAKNEVAKQQRVLVRKALAERERVAAELAKRQSTATPMPGSGEAL